MFAAFDCVTMRMTISRLVEIKPFVVNTWEWSVKLWSANRADELQWDGDAAAAL